MYPLSFLQGFLVDTLKN